MMTKQQASNWVRSNCVFAMNQDLISMVKKAAMEKGVELTNEASVCHAAHALVLAALPGEAANVKVLMREVYRELSSKNPEVNPQELALAVAEKIVGSTTDKNDPQYFRQRPMSARWAKELLPTAREYITSLSKGELATMYGPSTAPIGPNAPHPPDPNAPRTRLSPPKFREPIRKPVPAV
jgi:hypothetical protein